MRSPLVEAGCGKNDVRALARHLGLPVWTSRPPPVWPAGSRPAPPCRCGCWLRLRPPRAYLKSLGLRQVRVRHHGEIARIETDAEGVAIVTRERESIDRRLTALGFRFVTLDLAGYRSGSLNPAGGGGETTP